jgi:hypothetical protein
MEVIAIFGIISSFGLLCSTIFYLYLANDTKKWNKVSAILDKSCIEKITEEPPRFKVFINYHYAINSKVYFSNRVGFFPTLTFSDLEQAKSFLNSFITKTENINIFVHPYLSNISVVLSGVQNKLLFLLGICMSSLGLICFVYLYFYI